ncbi:MAG TPA: hypothetical protein VGB85_34355, partial [Nannocystis sp.]
MSTLHRLLALALALISGSAPALLAGSAPALLASCAPDSSDEPEAAESRVPFDAADASVASGEPALGEWQAWLSGELARAEQERPAAVAQLRAVAPVATRAG